MTYFWRMTVGFPIHQSQSKQRGEKQDKNLSDPPLDLRDEQCCELKGQVGHSLEKMTHFAPSRPQSGRSHKDFRSRTC